MMKSTKVVQQFLLVKFILMFSVHLNTNFAYGPSIQGRKFKKPTVPFSTRGELEDADVCKDCYKQNCKCTHMRKFDFSSPFFLLFIAPFVEKIPSGSIVEMTLTSYNWNAVTHFHHPVSFFTQQLLNNTP